MTAADNLCERLIAWDVNTIYGFPGDGINGILGALRRHEDELRFVQTRHEEMAAFMACGHAKFTGEVGVCMATSGPGAIHLLNGLYDAKLDHQPVVAIVGQTFVRAIGGDFQQEVNLMQLYSDVASAFCEQANEPSSIRHLVDRAIRIAKSERTVTCVIVPADVQDMDAVEAQPHKTHTVHSGIGYWPGRRIPARDQLERAAEILNRGERVAMLVGQGALHATDEVIAVADELGAGHRQGAARQGGGARRRPVLHGEHRAARHQAELGHDAGGRHAADGRLELPLLGVPAPGRAGQSRADRHLGADAQHPLSDGPRARGRQPREPQGAAAAARAKAGPLVAGADQAERRGVVAFDGRTRRSPRIATGVSAPRACSALSPASCPDNAILSSDSGSAANWYARHIRIRRGMKAMLSGNLATMVPGVPYAIAAKFAYPDRVAIAMVGDGAMQMGGMAEMLTAAKYYRSWSDPRLVVLVLNNEDLNQVTWEQRVMEGDPAFDASQEIPDVDYAAFAEQIGLRGIKLTRSSEIDEAWREALSADRPVVINALTDPNEAPLPPHITFEQAENFAKSVLADPSAGLPGAVESVRTKVHEFLPGR